MSFMFKPLTYDDPNAVNHIELKDSLIKSVTEGNLEVTQYISDYVIKKINSKGILVLDGYVSTQFDELTTMLTKQFESININYSLYNMQDIYKNETEINELTKENLPNNYEEDPVQLFGKLFDGEMEELIDTSKLSSLISNLKKSNHLSIVYGMGSAIQQIRKQADVVIYVDITPKVSAIRAREEKYKNIGDHKPRPFNALMRRNYFVDFEVTLRLRKQLIDERCIDLYLLGSNSDKLQIIEGNNLFAIFDSLVQYPFRAKPVYLEGIWGGEYIRKIRNIPMDISSNIAWIFEFIPMEVSIEIAVGSTKIDVPFFTFVQSKGEEIIGTKAYKAFEGFFPIRFNYDDTWHSDGNMSIQVHPDEDFVIENYNEFGRQDEAYYVIATGHHAKTYVGWEKDGNKFMELAKKSEKDGSDVDYQQYIHAEHSVPGKQIMLPAGTIHSSGQNQFILELGSLTIGSYTYKVYDYNRRDGQGNLRPIHSVNAEKVLRMERDKAWVKENIVIEPILIKEKKGYKEFIVGKTDLMYFQTNRIEINTHQIYEGKNNNQFTVLTLVDGEEIKVYSKSNPKFSFTQKYLEIITIPATISDYVIEAKGYQPVVVHKTILKDGYSRYIDKRYFNRKGVK